MLIIEYPNFIQNKKLNANQSQSQKLITEIEKKKKLSDNLVLAAFYGIIGAFVLILVVNLFKLIFWLKN